MFSRVTASLMFSALFVLFAFGTTASANGDGGEVSQGPYVKSNVVFDGDFAYWVQIAVPLAAANAGSEPKQNKEPRKVQEIVQQQLSTGISRRMFATTSKRIELRDLRANAGRLAFVVKSHDEARESRPIAAEKYTVYAMSAGDTVAAPLASETMVYRGKFKTKKHKGEKYRYFEAKHNCGGDVRTQDISELGVVLVTRTTVSCKRVKSKAKKSVSASGGGGYYKYQAFGYAPGSPVAMPLGEAPYGPMRLRGNELIGTGPENTVVARDVSTGTLRPYANLPEPSAIVASNDRRLAVTSNVIAGKFSPPTQTLTIFPPAANAPAIAIPIAGGEASVAAFCGDHFVQLSGPLDAKVSYWTETVAKGPFKLTLRDFTGAVVSEVAGPATGRFAGITCNGRLAHVATAADGPLTLTPVAL